MKVLLRSVKSIAGSQSLLTLARIPSNTVISKIVLFQGRMFSNIHLPRLPIPALSQTIDKIKLSSEPFAKDAGEHKQLCAILDEFSSSNSTGHKLQKLLELKASKTDNWLSHDWWVDKGYLEGRDSVMIWSSPGLVFPKLPKSQKSRQFVTEFISRLILSVLDFRTFLKNGGNPEASPKKPDEVPQICMEQYKKGFGTTRNPGNPKDEIIYGQLDDDNISIIISRLNTFYELKLPANATVDENLLKLKVAITTILNADSKQNALPLGSLTALSRNDWATAYSLLDKNGLSAIQRSQFVVCIDHIASKDLSNFDTSYSSSLGKQILHADVNNIGNRYFDKTIQLIPVLNSAGDEVIGIGICYGKLLKLNCF